VSDPESSELLACRRAVILAKEMGSVKLILESDCAGAMSKLRSGELDRSAQGPLVEDIKALLGEFEDVLITHVRRSCNEVAHRLAKAGCRCLDAVNKAQNLGIGIWASNLAVWVYTELWSRIV
jgi:hypothetical protein